MNRFKKSEPPEGSRPVTWCSYGYYLAERPRFNLDPLWHAGAYYVQDASSMFLEAVFRALDLPSEPLIMDCCASPGGKSTHILSLLNGKGLLVANEVVPKRNAVLVENIIKWGQVNNIVTQAEIPDLRAAGLMFDVVLVDAPCSGEGLFRKDESAAGEWSEEHVRSCAARQSHILRDVGHAVKPGGYLIYSTCTYSTEENEDQVEKLIADGEWEHADHMPDPQTGIAAGRNGVGLRFYPHLVEGEGLYIACLRKRNTALENKVDEMRDIVELPARTGLCNHAEDLVTWVCEDALKTRHVEEYKGRLHIFPKHWLPVLEILRKTGKLQYFGVMAGGREGLRNEVTKPLHSLALSGFVSSAIPCCPLTQAQAEAYLRKESPGYDPSFIKGWNLVQYKGINLGWMKVLDGRVNNYYPKAWSIRP